MLRYLRQNRGSLTRNVSYHLQPFPYLARILHPGDNTPALRLMPTPTNFLSFACLVLFFLDGSSERIIEQLSISFIYMPQASADVCRKVTSLHRCATSYTKKSNWMQMPKRYDSGQLLVALRGLRAVKVSRRMTASSPDDEIDNSITAAPMSFDEIDFVLNDWSQTCFLDSQNEDNEEMVCDPFC